MLEIVGIRKKFVNSGPPVLDDIHLHIPEGECLSLLGPSGCGKTTLLRILAGLETPDAGDVLLDGKSLLATKAFDRPFHMVFQRHALFPHLNVFENVAFALRVKKAPEDEVKKKVLEALAMVRLQGFETRSPATLSGGQSQRVALARALVNRPRVLLLDEPFSALDLKLRESMATELRDLQKELRLTFIFVTHDQQEAFALSDRVALMNQGLLAQVSNPKDMYYSPKSAFVARFVGQVAMLPVEELVENTGKFQFKSQGQNFGGILLPDQHSSNCKSALIRPENFSLTPFPAEVATNFLQVTVRDWIFKGATVSVRALTAGQSEVLVQVPFDIFQDRQIHQGQTLELFFRVRDTWLCSEGTYT